MFHKYHINGKIWLLVLLDDIEPSDYCHAYPKVSCCLKFMPLVVCVLTVSPKNSVSLISFLFES